MSKKSRADRRAMAMKASQNSGSYPVASGAGRATPAPSHLAASAGTDGQCCSHFDPNRKEFPGCHGHRAGLLTSNEIRELALITSHDADEYQGTSYDLCLGEGHYVTRGGKWKAVWIGLPTELTKKKEAGMSYDIETDPGERTLRIEPYGAALIQLKESVDTRTCLTELGVMVCGRFDLRLGVVRQGLISQQATQVEPNYTGKLFCYLFNQTGKNVDLSYADRVATIEFFYASCMTFCNIKERTDLLDVFNEKHKTRYQKPSVKLCCSEHGIEDVHFFNYVGKGEDCLPENAGLQALKADLDAGRKEVGEAVTKIDGKVENAVKDKISGVERELTLKRDHQNRIVTIIVAIIVPVLGLSSVAAVIASRYKSIAESHERIVKGDPSFAVASSNVVAVKRDMDDVINAAGNSAFAAASSNVVAVYRDMERIINTSGSPTGSLSMLKSELHTFRQELMNASNELERLRIQAAALRGATNTP